ncbi:transposase [Streptomyces sp. ISL-111]|nr:transposase [Streptomyces sp. ISL-111]MBT2425086.1 transposase [Streptomyces sp. ISL-112]MBT2460261.1 transposase [Streptomyces sp. ISL-63]
MQTFMEDVFRAFQRPEQRRWAQAYLWALINVSGRKTPRRMAQAKPLPSAAAHGLHQFINGSPWDWVPVRRRLTQYVAENTTPNAWTVAELIIPKRGEHSVGVHQRTDPMTGRRLNCQRALIFFLVSGTQCYPVEWSLMLGGPWVSDRERKRRARIPGSEAGRTPGDHVVRYAAEAAVQPHLPRLPWVLDLTHCDDAAGVLAGLARLRADVVCEVHPSQLVLTGQQSPALTTVGALMEARHARQTHVLLRQHPGGRVHPVPVHASVGTVGPPRPGNGDDGSRPYRILERPDPDGRQPPRYWLTTDHRVEEALRLARSHTAALSTVATLRQHFGVLDFEGRSFPGWHHHMTMASAAYISQRLVGPPSSSPASPGAPFRAWAPPPVALIGATN